jgi:hypothetical protein
MCGTTKFDVCEPHDDSSSCGNASRTKCDRCLGHVWDPFRFFHPLFPIQTVDGTFEACKKAPNTWGSRV